MSEKDDKNMEGKKMMKETKTMSAMNCHWHKAQCALGQQALKTEQVAPPAQPNSERQKDESAHAKTQDFGSNVKCKKRKYFIILGRNIMRAKI